MKRLLLCLIPLFLAPLLIAKEESLSFGRFGKITLYYETPQPSHVALFISGDGGWNLGVVNMARELAKLDALIVGIDINLFVKAMESSSGGCLYPAADLELLSKFVQKKLDYPNYQAPILIGYSSGATLVYANLVQAPPNTFLGGISLGFCPDLMLKKPMCQGSGLEWTSGPKGKGYNFLPTKSLEVPWIALQGTIDQVCDTKLTESFVGQVPNGEIIILPHVGHGFSVEKNWMSQFRQAFSRIAAGTGTDDASARKRDEKPTDLSDLPLIEVPAADSKTDMMGIIFTGDGGWGVTDRGIAAELAAKGIPVVGVNSLHYFWKDKTPEQTAKDLDRILQHYMALWHRKRAIIVGYSFGADVLPFALNRIPHDSLDRIEIIALLGLSSTADFQFHLTDWLMNRTRSTSRSVRPEVEKLRGKKILCFYGTNDEDALCRGLDPGLAEVVAIKGGHRFGKDFQPIVNAIIEKAR